MQYQTFRGADVQEALFNVREALGAACVQHHACPQFVARLENDSTRLDAASRASEHELHASGCCKLQQALMERIRGNRGVRRIERSFIAGKSHVVLRPTSNDEWLDERQCGLRHVVCMKTPQVIAADTTACFDQHDTRARLMVCKCGRDERVLKASTHEQVIESFHGLTSLCLGLCGTKSASSRLWIIDVQLLSNNSVTASPGAFRV